jgi:EF-hand domain-containing family member B
LYLKSHKDYDPG